MKSEWRRINAKAELSEKCWPTLGKLGVGGRIQGATPLLNRALLISLLLVNLAILLVLAPHASAQSNSREVIVAAAADLSSAMQEIADRYQKQTGVDVKLSFAASGSLTQQIENGAPFDIFFSADMDYPRTLIAAGDADAGSLYEYAVGKLVLWVPANSPLDVKKGMDVLLDPAVKKIAIANPEHAPYGRAAVAALKHVGLYDRVSDRLVLGENIAQAAQFAESGNAQVGFVALAHVVAPSMQGKGKYWIVPAGDYPPLAQGAVIVSHSAHKKEAAEFLAYIKSKPTAELLRRYGFEVP
jgi:molybdate transport system substrate-binding protein